MDFRETEAALLEAESLLLEGAAAVNVHKKR
jgi:hypothetical protein